MGPSGWTQAGLLGRWGQWPEEMAPVGPGADSAVPQGGAGLGRARPWLLSKDTLLLEQGPLNGPAEAPSHVSPLWFRGLCC